MSNRIILNPVSYHGKGAIREIPGIAKSKGFQHVFVCSDPDLIQFGVTAKVTDLLEQAGIPYTVYSGIKPNPTIENVKEGVEAFKSCGADSIITIGGGSSMDTAKAIGIIITNPECSLSGRRCPDQAPCSAHHCGSHNGRYRGGSHDQLRHHRYGKRAQVRLRR